VWCVVRVDGVGVGVGWDVCVCVCSCDGFRVVVVVVGRRAREARGGEDLARARIANRARFATVYACVRLVCASCVVSCVVWCACRVVVWCEKRRTTDGVYRARAFRCVA